MPEYHYEAVDTRQQPLTGRVKAATEIEATARLRAVGLTVVMLHPIVPAPVVVPSDAFELGVPPPLPSMDEKAEDPPPPPPLDVIEERGSEPTSPAHDIFDAPTERPDDTSAAFVGSRQLDYAPWIAPQEPASAVPLEPARAVNPREPATAVPPLEPATGVNVPLAVPDARNRRLLPMAHGPSPEKARGLFAALPKMRIGGGGIKRSLQVAVAFRELSVMLHAGLPIVRALDLLATTIEDDRVAKLFADARDSVEKGKHLSYGLELHEEAFPGIVLQLVRVGEESGRLPEMLKRLADFLEKQAELQMKVASALTYPLFMFVMYMGVVVVGPTLLFDSIFELLRDMHAEVPAITRVLMGLGTLSKQPLAWLGLFLALTGLGTVYRGLMRVRETRRLRDRWLLRAWGFGGCLRYICLVTYAQTLETLYSSGIPILTALKSAGRATGNLEFEHLAIEISDAVGTGVPLHLALESTGSFPPLFVHMLASASESGSISESLTFVAIISQEEVEQRIATAVAMLEPAMLFFMGCVVGIIVIATISPLMKVLETLTF